MKVPYLDLSAHHAPLREEFAEAIEKVIDCGAFAGGPVVTEFEKDFAEFCQTDYAVGVGSGTDALWLSLVAMDVGPGDEVITVPMTFIATVEAISRTGATPVFVDIDESTYTMDVSQLEVACTSKTKAIIPVHLFGQMADMTPILELADKLGIHVVEDAAQAHGASYQGAPAGSLGSTGCFSFYPGKNLGAFGEAGAVVTSDRKLADRMRVFRDHGQQAKYQHSVVGWNCRMDGIQAAVLQVKLRHLSSNNEKRRENAECYRRRLEEITGLMVPTSDPRGSHVWHIYAIRVSNRGSFMAELESRGIGCGIHYPVPIHLQPAYADLGYGPGSFPVSERCGKEFVSLPMFPELTQAQIEVVTTAIEEGFSIDQSGVEALPRSERAELNRA